MLALIFAIAMQSDPPPYVRFIEEAEALGRASYMAGVCMGFEIIEADNKGAADLIDDFTRRAIIAGTELPILDRAMAAAADHERQAVKTMLDLGPDDGSERRTRREAQAAEFLGTRCADLVIDYPTAFRLVED